MGWCDVDAQRIRSYFWGLLPRLYFWQKLIKKCDHQSTDSVTDRQTDRHTLWQKQTEFIICSILYAKAMGQIITLTTCYHYYYKIKLESLSLSCKSHRAKTAHTKILSANSTKGQEGQTASTCQISWRSIKPLRAEIWRFFYFFQDGGRPPSWICDARVRTTHEGHLVVFIPVQNLVGIDAVISIIC